jgi:N-acetylneuraminic acid mutarotase
MDQMEEGNVEKEKETHDISLLSTSQLTPVAGHVCVSYRGSLVCWGGYYATEQVVEYRLAEYVYIHPYAMQGMESVWLRIKCCGNVPKQSCGSSALVLHDQLYVFGGLVFIDDVFRRAMATNAITCLDLRTAEWRLIHPNTTQKMPTPRDKTTAWTAHDKLYFFGGYGPGWRRLDDIYMCGPNEFLEDESGNCWNNQLIEYDVAKNSWHKVTHSGSIPSQRAAASAVYIAELDKVFLFGGRHELVRLNDLYELDMKSKIWTNIDMSPAPIGRSWSSFTYIPSSKKVILYGGFSSDGNALSDFWDLDLKAYFDKETKTDSTIRPRPVWIEQSAFQPRLWHGACLIERKVGASTSKGKDEAVLFYGGMDQSPNDPAPFVGTLLERRIQPPSLYTLSLRTVAKQGVLIDKTIVPKRIVKQVRLYQNLYSAQCLHKKIDDAQAVYTVKTGLKPWLYKIFDLLNV